MINPIILEDLDFILKTDLPWNSFSGKTILISGANGLLPSYMVETLLNLNGKNYGAPVKIVCIVRNLKNAEIRFSNYRDRRDLVFFNQDVCTPIHYDGPIDFIIHAASQASPKYYGIDPVGTMEANTSGTRNLLELARIKEVESFLMFSSGEVYGQFGDNKMPFKETDYGFVDPLNVRSCYAESKRVAETMCVAWNHQYGVTTKIVRPFHTYGPMLRFDDGRVFADFVADVVNNRNIIMKSNGLAKRVFCYLADATIGFFKILLNGKNAEAYNLAGEQEISVIELANLLVNLFPEKHLQVITQFRENDNNYLNSPIQFHLPDISKLKSLGWKNTFSIEDGFHRTIKSFQI